MNFNKKLVSYNENSPNKIMKFVLTYMCSISENDIQSIIIIPNINLTKFDSKKSTIFPNLSKS